MKDFILLLVVIILLAPAGHGASLVGEQYDFPLAEGMVAMQAADTDFSSAKTIDSITPFPLCRCGGTGKESTGDGLEKVPCVCQPNCKCKKPNDQGSVGAVQQADVYTMYYFTASWCGPCRNIKAFELPMLVKAGWNIVEGDWVKGADIVVIDIDKNPAKFIELREPTMELIPTFVVTKNGQPLARHVGSIDHKSLAKWYNKTVTEDRAKK